MNEIVKTSLSLGILMPFLMVMKDRERSGFDFASKDLVRFGELLGVLDMVIQDLSFTCYSSGPSKARSRLDKFFISCKARGWCHNVSQRAMFRLVSNHIPIVLSSG